MFEGRIDEAGRRVVPELVHYFSARKTLKLSEHPHPLHYLLEGIVLSISLPGFHFIFSQLLNPHREYKVASKPSLYQPNRAQTRALRALLGVRSLAYSVTGISSPTFMW